MSKLVLQKLSLPSGAETDVEDHCTSDYIINTWPYERMPHRQCCVGVNASTTALTPNARSMQIPSLHNTVVNVMHSLSV